LLSWNTEVSIVVELQNPHCRPVARAPMERYRSNGLFADSAT